MKFGIFYEHQLPRPWHERSRVRAVQELARPDRARRPARLRLRLGGRAPLPRGVLALLRARGVPRRRQPAHEEHPPRPRHHPAHDQPSGARRRARGHARPASPTAASSSASARARASPSCTRSTAASATSATSGRTPCARSCRCSANDGWEYHGEYFDFPLRNVVPKPLQKPHPPLWVACSQLDTIAMAGQRGMGALGFQFVSAEAAHAWVNAYYNAFVKRLEKLARLPDESEHRGRERLHVRRDRRGGACAKADGWTFFQFALRFYSQHGPVGPGSVNMWARVPGVGRRPPAGQKSRAARADRLARDDAPEAARVRGRRTSIR